MVDNRMLREPAHGIEDEWQNILWYRLAAIIDAKNRGNLCRHQLHQYWSLDFPVMHGIADVFEKTCPICAPSNLPMIDAFAVTTTFASG